MPDGAWCAALQWAAVVSGVQSSGSGQPCVGHDVFPPSRVGPEWSLCHGWCVTNGVFAEVKAFDVIVRRLSAYVIASRLLPI
jgi:hypothetical protein